MDYKVLSNKYQQKINRVIDMIRMDVSQDLCLDDLADTACMSKFHFMRIFSYHMGETPHQFVTRLRIECAANKLLLADKPNITQIALDTGFSGSDTFARSFRQRYSYTPKTFKNTGQLQVDELDLEKHLQKPIYRPKSLEIKNVFPCLSVKLEYKPEYHVAYIRHIGPYGNLGSSISDTFSNLIDWARLRGIYHNKSSFLGRNYDNCAITPASHCMYDACLVLEDTIKEDHIVSMQTIPAGLYAVLDVTCTSPQIHRIWEWLKCIWLPNSDRRLRSGASYEFTPPSEIYSSGPEFDVQLCLPVE